MRLIDADALWDELTEDLEDGDVLYRIPPSYIDDAPTVDAVPVVRCKDCKYYKPDEYECGCDFAGGLPYVKAGDFCSYGERNEDENGRT